MRRGVRVGIAVGLVFLFVAAAASFALANHAEDDHSAYRAGNADLQGFREELEAAGYPTASLATSPVALRDAVHPARTLLVVAGVERPYRPSEVDALEAFVRAGGRLILADDTGNANEVSRRFEVFFSAIPVLDDHFRTNISLVNVTGTLPRSSGEPLRYSPVVMNVPTSLTIPKSDRNGTVLASTSDSSFGDVNGNARRDPTDLRGPFVVAYHLKVGAGRVVFLGDPDALASALVADRALANRKFLEDLTVALLPDGGSVVFDESRHGAPLLTAFVGEGLALAVSITREPLLRWLALLVAAGAGLVLVALVRGEEALGHHVPRLDAAAPVQLDSPNLRLRRAARVLVRLAHGARPEDDPAKLATDPTVAKLVASENDITPDKDLPDIVQRVRAYGASARNRGRGPP